MKSSTAKKRRVERMAIRSKKKNNQTENQENIPPNSEANPISPMQPNRVSPNSLSDITNECESPRMKRMRIIKETKDKRKKGESSSAPSTNLDQNLDETTPNVDETTQNGKSNGNGFPCTAASRRKTNVHKEPYMQESRHDNHKEAPSKDHASSSRSHNSLYNSEEYDDNGDASTTVNTVEL
ncbi:LOW QUALITY PROTEIN: uncharacterized protein LOC9301794 [Arabidopsis lyrata subsp. lyrata]|uniref:LOW QUALITY PROTEIN: uncharacterized protein LOC9301794 n=1 Tax=Arabidopsis lyrata subsp. lyrata TaxID=81972 RepID=UPI000A29E4B3|nr:LOW QUALITY PROTEIN: uncharacterized protein LOC9301794 [Arabidopsis lyrata subsp. lyrata]|eukprot:XP_020871078.1 LOW QUALITY PROTEIN: uncharacterized protein LOC9301794 [Arabidopsis lyrata subsp. lyrata]